MNIKLAAKEIVELKNHEQNPGLGDSNKAARLSEEVAVSTFLLEQLARELKWEPEYLQAFLTTQKHSSFAQGGGGGGW